jgi:hypothetical protein
MHAIDRRSALGALLTSSAIAMAPLAIPAQGRAQEQRQDDLPREDELETGMAPCGAQSGTVLFWSRVARELNAFDHSFVARVNGELPEDQQRAEAKRQLLEFVRAIGPCLSARAFGLVHLVLADALFAVAPNVRYRPHRKTLDNPGEVAIPPLFVAGATSSILRHIYDSEDHLTLIGSHEAEFMRGYAGAGTPEQAAASWNAGVKFAEDLVYRDYWNGSKFRELVDPEADVYKPGDRQGVHRQDPTNPEQGFYGQQWGSEPRRFVLSANEVEEFCPPPPDDFQADLEEVRMKGKLELDLVPVANGQLMVERSEDQEKIGLFWAYDGARQLGTPPRLYNQIVEEVAASDGLDEIELARLLALCNVAMSDAGNVAWYAKYLWEIPRPIIGIRNHATEPMENWLPLGAPRTNPARPPKPAQATVAADQTTEGSDADAARFGLGAEAQNRPARVRTFTVQDVFLGGGADEEPEGPGGALFAAGGGNVDAIYGRDAFTPNFPAYPSGHATFGAACFNMLRSVRKDLGRGTNGDPDALDRRHYSDEVNGIARDNFQKDVVRPMAVKDPFPTITSMIEENNDSRVWLGVHWRVDSTSGEIAGQKVAEAVHRALYPVPAPD